MKEKVCDLCGEKTKGNFRTEVKLICCNCVSRLRETPEERIRQAIVALREKDNLERASLLEGFIGKEKVNGKVAIGKGTDFSGHRRRAAYGAGFM